LANSPRLPRSIFYIIEQFFLLYKKIIATNAVINSEIGYAIHTPVIPNNFASIITIGIITTHPLKIETPNDCSGNSTELKYDAKIILIPTKRNEIKYNSNPCEAICPNTILLSRVFDS
jgi:hypothetical protein